MTPDQIEALEIYETILRNLERDEEEKWNSLKRKKKNDLLRAAIFAPSGGGKTYSSLRIAKGLGGETAFIDTERGSAKKYADRFDFSIVELNDKTIDGYCLAIKAASIAGFKT
jgi:hypothetical protein